MMTFRNQILIPLLILLVASFPAGCSATATPDQAAALHVDFSRLLDTYVRDNLVNYAAWAAHAEDKAALGRYVDQLSALDPAEWPADHALAYWINLYNAVTLRLILDNYPLDSIKDLGGFLKTSPWKRELVTVGDRDLNLNNIENDIIRPDFGDPRIHFALNCASVGCPPLGREAFVPDQLSVQLDAACIVAMNHDRWVRVTGDTLELTKIFDWYGEDFTEKGSSVLEFIRRYRTGPLPAGKPEISFMSYDWSLNETPGPDGEKP